MQALELQPQLFKALDKLKFTDATEVQSKAIPVALQGKDLIVSAKTGSGKTAAFILPMLNRFLGEHKPNGSTRGLILLPTRELAMQTQKAFEALAGFTQIKCGLIMGGEAYNHQVATLRRNPEVIIATPGRLVNHIEKGNVDFSDLEFLVLDEADRMLDMGFADDMLTITRKCNKDRQNFLFSATLKHQGFRLISEEFKNPVRIEVDHLTHGHSQIVQQIVLADNDKHKENLVAAIIAEEDAKRVFVFCNTRLQAQKVSNILTSKKMVAAYIHGEVSQSDRKQVMNRFRDGKIQVLVATDVAARGLDIDDIDLVINYTVAHCGDDHVHRVGRTGRAGKEGKAVTLVSELEWNNMSSIERYLKIRFEPRKIKSLVANYTGPKQLKASGKAVGPKKKKMDKATIKAKKKTIEKKAKKISRVLNKTTDMQFQSSPTSTKPTSTKSTSTKSTSTKSTSTKSTSATSKTHGDGFGVFQKRK